MSNKKPDTQPHICIIGGGAAGLSAGYFLKQCGYRNITILEKEDRIGGKCLSLTYGGASFDLGANYITSAYRQVKRLAHKFGARMYTEGRLRAYDREAGEFSSLLKAVLRRHGVLRIGWWAIVFFFKRWRLNRVISPRKPGFKGIADHPELCRLFGEWLDHNGLSGLAELFEVPISLMGYGQLTQIPAAYALTYMSTHTFLDLGFAAVNPYIRGYPKRFKEGYQRFWERVAWELDVILGAEVTQVRRGTRITVEFQALEERLAGEQKSRQQLECDFLIVGAPLYLASLERFISDLTPVERELFGKVTFDPFIVTTYVLPGAPEFTAATFMLPEPATGQPFVITRQFEDNDLISIYTRTEYGAPIDKDTILANNAAFIRAATGLELGDYYSYSEFPYFPHVDSEVMADGFYDRLEAIQGENRTYYVGGLMNFELVETITNYSKHLVSKHFPRR